MKQLTATCGPYRGYVITFQNDAEADQALVDLWAVAQSAAPFDLAVPPQDFPELSQAERDAAEAAARAWFDAQQPVSQRQQ